MKFKKYKVTFEVHMNPKYGERVHNESIKMAIRGKFNIVSSIKVDLIGNSELK